MNTRQSHYLAMLVLSALISVVIFGLSQQYGGMAVNEKGEMSGCIFMNKPSVCTMTLTAHLQALQNMLVAIPSKVAVLAFLILALGLALFISINYRLPLLTRGEARKKLYLHRQPDLPIFNFLKRAFSQGILNPKIY